MTDFTVTDDGFSTISVFQEEYRYWRVQGLSHVEAKNKAIDYYRQYTRREVLESEVMTLDSFQYEGVSDVDRVHFNQIVRQFLAVEYGRNGRYGNKEKLTKLLFLVIRMESLDDLLDADLLQMSTELIGDARVDSMQEIAVALGYKVKANGCSNSLTELKYGLQNVFKDFGFVDFFNGHYSLA